MNFKLRSLVAATLAGSMLMGFGTSAMADSTDDILNALIAKGILTEEEGALLQKGRTGEKEAAEAKKKTAVSSKNKDGSISFETGDGKNTMALTGRMQFDMRSVSGTDSNSNNGTAAAFASDTNSSRVADQFELRRARIGVKGKMAEHFDYEVISNLVGSNTNTVDVAYINAGMYKQAQLKLGQFKQPFNLEEYGTSSNNIDFMERSYINQITPGKKIGAMLHGVPTTGITYAGSVYQQNNFGETDSNTDGKGLMGRLTANFAELAGWNESVLHVGVAGFDSEYGVVPVTSTNTTEAASAKTRGTVFAFNSEGRGLNNIYRAQIGGDTSAVSGINLASNSSAQVDNKAYGLELAATRGPFKVQGEFMDSKFDASNASTGSAISADVKAYYAEVLWMLTGENYSDWYKNGAWSGIKPKSNFDVETGKGKGAWEIGFRYDQFEVDNTSITQGTTNSDYTRLQGATNNQVVQTTNAATKQSYNTSITSGSTGGAKTYTAGIKWQLNPNMRVLLNYSHTKFDNPFKLIDVTTSAGGNVASNLVKDEDLVMLRTQFSF
jgi:phosphate-selective porin OprO/OprP